MKTSLQSRKNLRFSFFIATIALGLLLIMFSHDAIPHEHDDHVSGGIQLMAHNQDRKWWFTLTFILLFISTTLFTRETYSKLDDQEHKANIHPLPDELSLLLNPLRITLRTGILQPKTY